MSPWPGYEKRFLKFWGPMIGGSFVIIIVGLIDRSFFPIFLGGFCFFCSSVAAAIAWTIDHSVK